MKLTRLLRVAVGLSLCLAGMMASARMGLSRLLTNYSLASSSNASARGAIRFDYSDPEAHNAYAVALTHSGEYAMAAAEFQRAAELRPKDYALWMELGSALDRANDGESALRAFREAVSLAPFYARPRWQLGNLLLRMGRIEEGLGELRQAVDSNPSFYLSFFDLAWKAYDGKGDLVERALAPQSARMQTAYARLFFDRGDLAEAVNLYRAAGDDADDDRRTLLSDLLAARKFHLGYQIWALDTDPARRVGAVTDGSFEGDIKFNETGFGWQTDQKVTHVNVSLDGNSPHSGAQSLLVKFSGDSNPLGRIISQLIVVKPNKNYKLTFAGRAEGVVSGSLPLISVIDASNNGAELAQLQHLPSDTDGWHDFSLSFRTTATTEAILLILKRQFYNNEPCPIFGQIWLDDLVLEPQA